MFIVCGTTKFYGMILVLMHSFIQGFASMKVGEVARLVIKSEYGYGDRGHPPTIPAKATLIFDVELLGFKEKEKEKWEVRRCILYDDTAVYIICCIFHTNIFNFTPDDTGGTYGKSNQA